MLFTPEQFIILGVVLLGGLLIGYACAPSPRKWKRRVREQSDSFTEHYAALEEQLRAANRRIDDMTVQNNALRADNVEAERTIGGLRAAAMAKPVVADPAPPAPALVETLPEPEPVLETAPVAEAERTPIVAEPVMAEAALAPATEHVAAEHEAAMEPVTEAHHEAIAETTPMALHDAGEEVRHEAPEGALVTGDTFPVVAHADTPGETAASLPAHPAPTGETHVTPEPLVADSEPVVQAPMTPIPTDAPPAPIGPAEPEMPSKGWFASSARDDLTRIRGIDSLLNTRLFSLGVVRFEDLEKLSAEDEMALEQRLALPVGYIAREQWRTQSALLRAGQTEEHAAHFGAEPVAVG